MRRNEENEVSAGRPFTDRLNAQEVGAATKSPVSAERKRAQGNEISKRSVLKGINPTPRAGLLNPMPQSLLLVDRDRETMTSLAATVREDLRASSRRHAGEEPVRTEAASVVGLIRAFRLGHGKKSGEEPCDERMSSSRGARTQPPQRRAVKDLQQFGLFTRTVQ